MAGILGFALLLAPATASSTAAAAHPSIASVSTAPYDAVPAQATAETSRAEPQASAVTIPDYAGYVTDAAGVMDEAARAKLDAEAFNTSCSSIGLRPEAR